MTEPTVTTDHTRLIWEPERENLRMSNSAKTLPLWGHLLPVGAGRGTHGSGTLPWVTVVCCLQIGLFSLHLQGGWQAVLGPQLGSVSPPQGYPPPFSPKRAE